MRTYLALALAAVFLVACNPGVDPGTTPDTTLSSMDVRSSYFLAAASGSRSIADGSLHYIESGQTGEVTWQDADGNDVSVTVSEAVTLGDYLVALITYEGEDACVSVASDGSLVSLEAMPDTLSLARESGGFAYYLSGGYLWSASLATGASAQLGSDRAYTASECYLKVCSGGVIVWPSSAGSYWYWYPNGDTTADYMDASFPDPRTGTSLEGLDGTIYLFNSFDSNILRVTTYTEGAGGGFTGVQTDFATMPWTTSTGAVRISSASKIHELVIGHELQGFIRILATEAGLSYSFTDFPDGAGRFLGDPYTDTAESAGDVYYAYASSTDLTEWHIWGVPTTTLAARALTGGPEELVVDYNIDGLTAVGGLLFYRRDAGSGVQTMVFDGQSSTVYSDGAVSIEAVE